MASNLGSLLENYCMDTAMKWVAHNPDDLLAYSWTNAPNSEGLSSKRDGLSNSFARPVNEVKIHKVNPQK